MSDKSLTEIMDSLPPERRAKVEARAKELKEEYPLAAEVIRELVEEREQLKARIAELEEELKYHKQQRKL
jgi:septal ring factor EnvC (AmiA/AmiB activator)